MIKVNDGQDPYSIIGKYIREHMTAIEDMIAIIEIDGYITNELFMVDMDADGYFVWKSDWWEGEKNVSLLDFFPVSDAQKPSAQPEPSQIARDIATIIENEQDMRVIAQPEIIRCRDCKKCQIDSVFHDYWCDGRKVRENHYCGYAERRTDERMDV